VCYNDVALRRTPSINSQNNRIKIAAVKRLEQLTFALVAMLLVALLVAAIKHDMDLTAAGSFQAAPTR